MALGESSKGGSRLNRSETVTVRLDPKLNYLCELAARSQRRTKSSFIEWAIADSLARVALPDVVEDGEFEQKNVTLKERAFDLWQVDEADRVVALAIVAPALLTHEEQLIWRVVRENGYIWKGRYDKNRDWVWETRLETLIKDRLRSNWEIFKSVASGDLEEFNLPKWTKKNPKSDNDLDDDVPF